MSRLRNGFIVAALVAGGCTQDYDEFQFGAGGAGATSSGGAGPTSTTTGATSTTGTTTTSSSTTTATSSTTTTTSTATTSTGMGGMGPVTVDCAGSTCYISAGEVCCADGATGACESGTCQSGGDIPVSCDEQADCPGAICCVFKSGGNVDSVQCASNCQGNNADPLCSVAEPCAMSTCTAEPDLPAGFMSCQ